MCGERVCPSESSASEVQDLPEFPLFNYLPRHKGLGREYIGVLKWGHWFVTLPRWSQNCPVSLPRMHLPPGAFLAPPPRSSLQDPVGKAPGSWLSHSQVVGCSDGRADTSIWQWQRLMQPGAPGPFTLLPISIHLYRQERPRGVLPEPLASGLAPTRAPWRFPSLS